LRGGFFNSKEDIREKVKDSPVECAGEKACQDNSAKKIKGYEGDF
jgi:hypothetical protein